MSALIHELFEARVVDYPDAVALICDGQELSYAELNIRSEKLARYLQSTGAGPRKLVGVCLERSFDLIVAILAIAKTGAAYVPVDPAWPFARMHSVLGSKEFETIALITDSARLRVAFDLQWSIPQLANIILIDVHTPKPASESLDQKSISSFWDGISESAVDRASAAGFLRQNNQNAFSEAEVDEYKDRVLHLSSAALTKNSRVLEIGCGSGLIGLALAPQIKSYVGLDPSELTQEKNRKTCKSLGYNNAVFQTGFAHDISRFEKGSYDYIIIASVVQFFPGPAYLQNVLSHALRLLSPGGELLLADILDPQFRTGHELHIDEHWFKNFIYEYDTKNEIELVIHRRKEGFNNELRHRFDLTLRHVKRNNITKSEKTIIKNIATQWDINHCCYDIPRETAQPSDPAYVIYTSGSTGTPKGVVVCHDVVINIINWVNNTFNISNHDRMLAVSSVCFDLSVYDIFGVLGAGASLYVAQRGELRDPEILANILTNKNITLYNSAPAVLQRLVPYFKTTNMTLRLVLLSGDWIPIKLPDALRIFFPSTEIIALGGATEATIWSNFFPIKEVAPTWKSIPYGKAVPHARYYVLDENLEECAPDIRGELYIGGSCLAAGYIDDPKLTALKFIESPFNPKERLYKTGDFARRWPDGNLEFLGRVDNQIKINGYRIELGEIEAALLEHPEIQEAVAIVREDQKDSRLIVAYYVPKQESTLNESQLRAVVSLKLPDYMRPSAFVRLSALPLTSNGKISRESLPPPQCESNDQSHGFQTSLEEELATIWSSLLQVKNIRREDNFFMLGGHSMILATLLFQIEHNLKVKINFREAYLNPTIAQFAELVTKKRNESTFQYAFDLLVGDELATFHLQKEEFEQRGVPAGALNFRILGLES